VNLHFSNCIFCCVISDFILRVFRFCLGSDVYPFDGWSIKYFVKVALSDTML
jgi:hypothetical protein